MAESEQIYRQLERHFFSLTARCDVNRELSFEILEVIRGLLDEGERRQIRELVDQFVNQRSDQLSAIYQQHFHVEGANPLIFQPETILILNRLEHDHYALRDAWNEHLPPSLLEELADIWGVPL